MFANLPLTVILIVIMMLHESITTTEAIFVLSLIYSIIVCSNSVTVATTIFLLMIADYSILIFLCHVTFHLVMLVLRPLAVTIVPLKLTNPMQLIFMPFSEKLIRIFGYHYPDSLSLTLRINVASVLAWPLIIVTIFVFNIIEPILDGLKFRLKQPLKLFVIGYTQSSIWKHLKAVVNLHHFFAYSLHDYLKTLMCRF